MHKCIGSLAGAVAMTVLVGCTAENPHVPEPGTQLDKAQVHKVSEAESPCAGATNLGEVLARVEAEERPLSADDQVKLDQFIRAFADVPPEQETPDSPASGQPG